MGVICIGQNGASVNFIGYSLIADVLIGESAQSFRPRGKLKLAFQDFPDMGMRMSTIYVSKPVNTIT